MIATIRTLADRHGVSATRLRNWLFIDRVRPAGCSPAGDRRDERLLYDPVRVAAVVAARTPPAGWPTVPEVADMLGLTVKSVHHRIRDGHMKAKKVNGRVYIDPATVATGPAPRPRPHKRGAKAPPARSVAESEEPVSRRDFGPEVAFGPSGLTLYAADLEHLARLPARRAGREDAW